MAPRTRQLYTIMWQRKQTLCLLFAIILLMLAPWLVIAQGKQINLNTLIGGKPLIWMLKPCSLQLLQTNGKVVRLIIWPHSLTMVYFTLIALSMGYSISQHQRRTRQLQLARLQHWALLSSMLWCLVLTVHSILQMNPMLALAGYSVVVRTSLTSLHSALLLPAGAWVLNTLATYHIRRDEALVRAADRLR